MASIPQKTLDLTPTRVSPARARLIVELPEGAKLYVDDRIVKTSSSTCSFRTPMLTAGDNYFYELRVETIRNGKTVSETKKVTVRAGEEVKTSFVANDNSVVAKAK